MKHSVIILAVNYIISLDQAVYNSQNEDRINYKIEKS